MITETEYIMTFLGEHELTLFVSADVTGYEDDFYQCDADGNRGIKHCYMEIDSIEIKDGRGNDVTKKVESKYNIDYQYIEEQIMEEGITNYRED